MWRIRVTATVLIITALFLPGAAAAQDGAVSVREALRAAGFELPTPAERAERARHDRRVQRLWSAALIGVGGVAGGLTGFSRNEWAFDEGWVGGRHRRRGARLRALWPHRAAVLARGRARAAGRVGVAASRR